MQMQVRFGSLDELLGRRVAEGDWTFIACVGKPDGTSFSFTHQLAEHTEASQAPLSLRDPLVEGYAAAWVRGRLPIVFGHEPAPPEVEKTLLHETFAAARGGEAFVFHCADHYGRTALLFSDDGPAEPTKDAIAAAFWRVLLKDPEDLANFRLRVFHPGAGVWLEYACEQGVVSRTESDG
jgi:hypothetical protein